MNKWYTISNHHKNKCGNCSKTFEGLATLDHHYGICPNCKIQCIWFGLKNKQTLQIIPKHAPKSFSRFLKWTQNELDEIEFLELIVSFEEIASSISTQTN